MTMHIEGPWLSTTGKRKGKVKFRNAEEARKARELEALWEENQAKWKSMSKPIKTKQQLINSPVVKVSSIRSNQSVPSLNEWVKGAVTVKQTPQYTGTKLLGIGTMHKSNAVPIFTDEQAKDISTMRRG